MQKFIISGVLVSLLGLGGCHGMLVAGNPPVHAEAALYPTQGNSVLGVVTFSTVGDKLRVVAELSGLTPGMHGFHIHERGDCRAPDATSTGGHFNPTGKAHGNPELTAHHAGDLPQLLADASGKARLTAYLDTAWIGKGNVNIVGRSLVVDASSDDFKTQPDGGSGAHVACGIVLAK